MNDCLISVMVFAVFVLVLPRHAWVLCRSLWDTETNSRYYTSLLHTGSKTSWSFLKANRVFVLRFPGNLKALISSTLQIRMYVYSVLIIVIQQ